MSRILLTGATGFIGRHLIQYLQDRHEIFALVRQIPNSNLVNVRWIEQDLNKPLDCSCLPQQIDGIIHLAQSQFYREFPQYAGDIFNVNIFSTFNLLEYARQAGAENFILASTGGLYGESNDVFSESHLIQPETFCKTPLSFYFTSKYSAELLVRSYQEVFRTVILRCFFVYGIGQKNMLISKLIQKIKNDETITIDGKPGRKINPIYVKDVVKILNAVLEQPISGTFNVAGNETISLWELVNLIGQVMGKEVNVDFTEATPKDIVGDNRAITDFLKIEPTILLAAGLKRTIAEKEE